MSNSNSTNLRLRTTRRPVVDQRRLVHAFNGVAEEERPAGRLGVEGPQIQVTSKSHVRREGEHRPRHRRGGLEQHVDEPVATSTKTGNKK